MTTPIAIDGLHVPVQLVPTLTSSHDLTPFEHAVDRLELSAPAPVVVQRVFALLADPGASWLDLAKALASDAGLVVRIVRLSSSMAFAGRPVRDLTTALQVLGADQLRRVVVTAQLAGRGSPFNRALWAYSLRVALTCQLLAERRGVAGGADPFLSGLLHDVGTMALEAIVGRSYVAMAFAPGDECQGPLERDYLGFDHADLGAMVAARWNLFPELELIAQLHHVPDACVALGIDAPVRVAIETVALARLASAAPDAATVPQRDRLCRQLAIEPADALSCGTEGRRLAAELIADLG